MTISPPAGRPGAQQPRISSWPDYVTSAGLEAVELAESAGLLLDPWQQFVLHHSLGERRDGRWSAFEVGLIVARQNGKGSVLEARELAGLFLFGEKLIIHTSHLFSTSLEAFRRIRTLIESTPDLDSKVNQYRQTVGQESIELRSGARLRFMARSKGSGRGLSGDLVVLDEAYELDDAVMEALLPTLLARPNPQLWYTSSPVLDVETGAPLTAMRKRGIAAEPGMAYFEWSVPEDADLDDRDNWVAANPASPHRVTMEMLGRARSSMTDAGFAREILCIWPPEDGAKWQVISRRQWNAQLATEPTTHDPVVLALDVTPDRRMSCLSIAGVRPDGDVGSAPVVHAVGTDWVVSRTVREVLELKPCRLVINAAGAAASVIPEIVAGLAEVHCDVEVVTPNAREEAAAYGMVHDALTRPEATEERPWRLWHNGDDALTKAVAAARTRKVGTEGTTWEWTEVDASPLKSVTHAVWGLVTRPVQPDFEPLVDWR